MSDISAADYLWLFLLALSWLGYFALHSLLASLRVKGWVAAHWPRAMAGYRLAYNGLALLLLLPLLVFSYLLPGEPLWRWQGAMAWLANGLALLAVAGFFVTLRYYDSSSFLGLRQWRERQQDVVDTEALHFSPLHRFVRHPWYSLALVILWTRDMNAPWLVSALCMSLYLVVGSRWEEVKLLRYHGARYAAYCRRVPGLLPRPWRFLSRAQARALQGGELD